LNLAGQPNKDIIDCYSPAQVVKAREYQQEKEALKAAEEQAKFDRKIKRAANAIRKKEEEAKRKAEREAKAAQAQLAKDQAAANKAAKKAPKKKSVSTTTKAKKAAPTVPIRRKVSTQSKAPAKALGRRQVVVPVEEVVAPGVVVAKTSSRTINLPQRFR